MPEGKKGFKKGHEGFKPKGSKSVRTLAWEQLGEFITDTGAERVKVILAECTPEKFMIYYPLLLEYFKPKLARIDTLNLPEDSEPLNEIRIVD
jgi:hypothetical protein